VNGIFTGKISNNNIDSGSFVRVQGIGTTVNINSNLRSASFGNFNNSLRIYEPCTVNIVGNITHLGSTTSNNAAVVYITNNAVVNITGNVVSNANTTTGRMSAIECLSGCTINITGNLSSTTNNGFNPAIYNLNSNCVINITGNINANNTSVIVSLGASTISVLGTITASNLGNGILSSNIGSVVIVSTPCFNSTNGIMAIQAANVKLLNSIDSQWKFETDLGGTSKTLYSPGSALGNPAVTDVRDGVTYASGALTGTLEVPPASSVAVGVPVDNTVGTAIISITDMGALLASYNV
jgi:hypothetical protein